MSSSQMAGVSAMAPKMTHVGRSRPMSSISTRSACAASKSRRLWGSGRLGVELAQPQHEGIEHQPAEGGQPQPRQVGAAGAEERLPVGRAPPRHQHGDEREAEPLPEGVAAEDEAAVVHQERLGVQRRSRRPCTTSSASADAEDDGADAVEDDEGADEDEAGREERVELPALDAAGEPEGLRPRPRVHERQRPAGRVEAVHAERRVGLWRTGLWRGVGGEGREDGVGHGGGVGWGAGANERRAAQDSAGGRGAGRERAGYASGGSPTAPPRTGCWATAPPTSARTT